MNTILQQTANEFWNILPILIGAVIIAQVINYYLSKDKLHHSFSSSEKNIIKASAIGLATPGPLLAYLPTLKNLQNKGLPASTIAAFITGQTLIGPLRLFLEINYFGALFFGVRVIVSFFTAIGIGTCFKLLGKYIKY